MQCSNNLKQVALSVHTFSDANDALPPIALGLDRASIFFLLLPFHEQQAIYDTVLSKGTYGIGFKVITAVEQFTVAERQQFPAVKIYQCPSRRSGPSNLIGHTNTGGVNYSELIEGRGSDNASGPCGDYVALLRYRNKDDSDGEVENLAVFLAGNNYNIADHAIRANNIAYYRRTYNLNRSPFIVASSIAVSKGEQNPSPTVWADEYKDWTPRTTFSSWADGTSNQLIFGEKYLPIEYIKKNHYVGIGSWDGSWLYVSDVTPSQIGRTIHASSVDPNNPAKQISLVRNKRAGSGSSGDVSDPSQPYPYSAWAGLAPAISQLGGLDIRFIVGGTNTIVTSGSTGDQGVNGFALRLGSEHLSTVNFAIGDGSVRSISLEADTATLSNLIDIDDGNPVTIP
jgi:hypothetical protein